MAVTYDPIATTTVGSAINSVTFSTISTSYTDLKIIANVITTADSEVFCCRINNDSTALYSYQNLVAGGAAATCSANTGFTKMEVVAQSATSNVYFQTFTIEIPSYNLAASKTVLTSVRGNRYPGGTIGYCNWLYRGSSAVTSLVFFISGSGTFAAGTRFDIYGIKAA